MSFATLKGAGGMAAGMLLLLVLLAVPIVFLMGAAKFSVWALSWIPSIVGVATVACAAMIPLAIIPPTRGVAATVFGLASFVFGACLWFYSLAFTYLAWGMIGVLVGIVGLGVGVVLTGTVAAVFSGMWGVLGNIALLFALLVGARLLSARLAYSADRRAERRAMRNAPGTATLTMD